MQVGWKELNVRLADRVTTATDDGRIVIYHPPRVAPYVSLEPRGAEVQIQRREANRLTLRVSPTPRPATLTIADMNLPGWRATIDGKAADLGPGPLMRLPLPASAKGQTIELRYCPPGLTAGLTVSAVSLAVLALAFVLAFGRRGG